MASHLNSIRWQHLQRVKPPGSYEHWKAEMDRAIEFDLPPSRTLITINNRLAAWEAYLRIGKVSSFPSILHIALNDICNARCRFCIYAPETSTANLVSADQIRKAKWLKFVHSFFPNAGLSEPLVHPEIAEILASVRENAPYINMHLTTNLSLMNEKLLPTFIGHLSAIIISLNAATEKTYEYLMPPLKWSNTMSNIKMIQDAKKISGTSLPELQVGYVLNMHNLSELPTLPGLLASLDIRATRIIEFAVPGTIASRKLLTIEDSVPRNDKMVENIFDEFRSQCVNHQIHLTHPLPTLGRRPSPQPAQDRAAKQCAPAEVSRVH